MAKKDEENPEPKPWTPDQPIPDEEGESEAQRRHTLGQRVRYLDDQAEEARKKTGKNKGKSGGGGWAGL